MEVGILLSDLPTRVPASEHFDSVLRQVEAAQRNGITYVMLGQHFLFPESRWLQPVPLLARLAGELDRNVRLATSVMLAPLYHPVLLAEELATLDIVSEGRLIVGLGTGYVPEEFETFGVPFEERVARLEECVALLEALWTNDRVTFEGQFWTLRDAPVHLRPVQEPRPPIWIGAIGRPGVRRAARIGDAWLITPTATPADVVAMVEMFAAERARLGKPMSPQPLRREIVVGRDREDAAGKAAVMGREWYQSMVDIGSPRFGPGGELATIADFVRTGFIVGSAEECVREIREIADVVPVDPVVTRAHWPGMSTEQALATIDDLGRELVPMLRQVEPRRAQNAAD
jgi:alkanesulfonate monooxygenase SsuD/methylene tetrahydromethanopterin reductase-like flavin-dependent oxidoreductase (luciferase family)